MTEVSRLMAGRRHHVSGEFLELGKMLCEVTMGSRSLIVMAALNESDVAGVRLIVVSQGCAPVEA